ncbi:MAG TPA: hypothetical protein VHH15_15035 [Actinophytocola sp.]|nr:hypothetical protein [Actinophytocola sp.]
MSAPARIADRAGVPAALADPALTMPRVPAGGPALGIQWLRRSVARFADGAEHDPRRRQVTSLLAGVAPARLRRLATERTYDALDAIGGHPFDLMARVARVVPIDVLVAALAMPPVPIDAVAVTARAYQPGSGAEEPADEAVVRLVEALGGVPDERTAARIGLLVQACDATAGLIGNAALAMLRADTETDTERPVDAIVAETLLHDPPVRVTRRLASDTGAVVEIDLAAGGLPFGAGSHQCPGHGHATAIAAGVLESVRGCRLVDPQVRYEQSTALRVPIELVVRR